MAQPLLDAHLSTQLRQHVPDLQRLLLHDLQGLIPRTLARFQTFITRFTLENEAPKARNPGFLEDFQA